MPTFTGSGFLGSELGVCGVIRSGKEIFRSYGFGQ